MPKETILIADIQIAAIRENGKPYGVTYKQLGDKYGITRSHICGILKGRYWEKL